MKISVGDFVIGKGYEIKADDKIIAHVWTGARDTSYELSQRMIELLDSDSEFERIIEED